LGKRQPFNAVKSKICQITRDVKSGDLFYYRQQATTEQTAGRNVETDIAKLNAISRDDLRQRNARIIYFVKILNDGKSKGEYIERVN
jgi:hypothetical protein